MMRAVVLHEFGGIDRMRIETVPKPEPAAGEIRLRVHHASVNPADWKVREGLVTGMFEHRFPLIPGWDAAGEVDAVGEGVTEFTVGDLAYAMCRKAVVQHGSYAEYVTLPAAWAAASPRRWKAAEIASVPLTGLTAWQGLFKNGNLQAGQTVLILGGAGGVGSFAVQLARNAGARVAASTSPRNADYVRSLGAEHIIDYTLGTDLEQLSAWAPDGVDLLFDAVRSVNDPRTFELVRHGGTLVYITGQPDGEHAAKRKLNLAYFMVEASGEDLAGMARLINSGKIAPPAVTEVSWTQAGEAHRMSQEGHVRGKLVLRID